MCEMVPGLQLQLTFNRLPSADTCISRQWLLFDLLIFYQKYLSNVCRHWGRGLLQSVARMSHTEYAGIGLLYLLIITFPSFLPFDNTTICWLTELETCARQHMTIIITNVHVILVANKSMFLSWLYRTIKECLSVTENLKSVTFHGIPLRERDLTCLAKVWWNILLVIY